MRVIAVLAAGLMLAACGSNPISRALDSRQNAGPCPPAAALYDASRIVEMTEGGTRFSDITYTGEITNVNVICRYVEDQPVRAELQIDFAFGKGPQATSNSHQYQYWVAVTRRSSKVLAKEYFAVDADFGGSTVDGSREVLQDIIIPRADDTISGANFEIVVGFQLTDEELAFNREGRRFRLDAASGS